MALRRLGGEVSVPIAATRSSLPAYQRAMGALARVALVAHRRPSNATILAHPSPSLSTRQITASASVLAVKASILEIDLILQRPLGCV